MSKQTIIPMLSYENGPAAMEWLSRAFGFSIAEQWLDDEGRLTHGALEMNGQIVMVATPTPHYQSPKTVIENYPPAAEWSQVPYVINGVLVVVENLDAHFANAKAQGATILSQIEDGPPGRRYRAEDLEGQRWFFLEAE